MIHGRTSPQGRLELGGWSIAEGCRPITAERGGLGQPLELASVLRDRVAGRAGRGSGCRRYEIRIRPLISRIRC